MPKVEKEEAKVAEKETAAIRRAEKATRFAFSSATRERAAEEKLPL